MILLPDVEATTHFGAALAGLIEPGDVIFLSGGLGAGKTSLARGLIRGLGHEGEVPSPTFQIVQTYGPPDVTIPLWHVDLYRIEHAGELEELGLDFARAEAAILIEWPERLSAGWDDALNLRLERKGEGRALTAQVPAAWEERFRRLEWTP